MTAIADRNTGPLIPPSAPTPPDPFDVARKRVAGLKDRADAERALRFLGRDAGCLAGAIEAHAEASLALEQLERQREATSFAADIDMAARAILDERAINIELQALEAEVGAIRRAHAALFGTLERNRFDLRALRRLVDDLDRLDAIEQGRTAGAGGDPATLTANRVNGELARSQRAELVATTLGSSPTDETMTDLRRLDQLERQRITILDRARSPRSVREGVYGRRPIFSTMTEGEILGLASQVAA